VDRLGADARRRQGVRAAAGGGWDMSGDVRKCPIAAGQLDDPRRSADFLGQAVPAVGGEVMLQCMRNGRAVDGIVASFLVLGLIVSMSGLGLAQQTVTRPARATTQPATSHPATRFPHTAVRYEHGPDSERHDGVPRGKISEFVFKDSKVFPGTIRRCAVYVPAQYDGSSAAALMVFQDGVSSYLPEAKDFRVPVVFDNLIAKKEMPVTIGVFVDPGYKRDALPAPSEPHASPENRSFEYDTLSADYATFVITEILPYVRREYGLKISDDPDRRAICGSSSGGICAWTVAWERPDSFRKVVSHVGSFTNIRGGNRYPQIIRESEWKPIRVFLQDGANDNRGDARYRQPGWNWVAANHLMAAALEEKDYDYKYVYGDGAHNGNHGGAIFPDTMRWLWRQ
jgi:enterochelin esterase-like enzyme